MSISSLKSKGRKKKGVTFKTMFCKSNVSKENFHFGAQKEFSFSWKLYKYNLICTSCLLVIRSLHSFVNMCFLMQLRFLLLTNHLIINKTAEVRIIELSA